MAWGGREGKALFQNVYSETGKHHPAYLRKPALRSDCRRYYDAYRHLGARRIYSQVGPQPIQISEIEALLNVMGIEDPDTRMKYVRLVERLDAVELKHIQAKTRK